MTKRPDAGKSAAISVRLLQSNTLQEATPSDDNTRENK